MRKSIMGFMIVFLLLFIIQIGYAQQTTTIPELRFQWDSNTEEDLDGYGFYSSLDPGPPYDLLEEVPKSTTATVDYTAAGIPVNVNAPTYFVVDAFDTAGNRSGFSNVCEYTHCVPLPDETQTISCPAGYTGTGKDQKRTSSCGFNTLPIWGAWIDIKDNCTRIVTCTPSTTTRTESCGTNYTGLKTYTKTTTCPAGIYGTPTVNEVLTSDTCVLKPPTCVATTTTRDKACPVNYDGKIVESSTTTCPDPYGVPVPGPWIETSNTCTLKPATCATSTQTQTRACDVGYSGQINESRTSTCPDPYGVPVWGAWIITSSTCAPLPVCRTSTETKTESCGINYDGLKTFTRTSTCASTYATPVFGPWIETGNTCTPKPATCTQSTITQTRDCGVGFSGQITESKTSTCPDPYGAPVWPGVWTITSNTCTPRPVCVTSTTERTVACPSGYEGVIVESSTSSCPDPYGVPVPGPWVIKTNTCKLIPVCEPLPTETMEEPCPTGFTGLIYFERESTCPGPVWGEWIETSRTCTATPECVSKVERRVIRCTKWYEKGSITQERTLICNPDGTSYWTSWTTVISNCRPWWKR